MKKIILSLILFYQSFLVYIIKNIVGVNNCCRFDVTCSEYSKRSIQKFGVMKGMSMSVRRFLKCQPFYNNATTV